LLDLVEIDEVLNDLADLTGWDIRHWWWYHDFI